MSIMTYKGYEGTAEIDMDTMVCRGKILFIHDLVNYQAPDPVDLQKEFEAAVDDYLETCEYIGREPQKPLKGSFNVRVSPELHKSAVIRAKEDGTSLNKVVARSLEAYLNGSSEVSQNITINMPPEEKIETYTVTPSTEATWGEQKYAH